MTSAEFAGKSPDLIPVEKTVGVIKYGINKKRHCGGVRFSLESGYICQLNFYDRVHRKLHQIKFEILFSKIRQDRKVG